MIGPWEQALSEVAKLSPDERNVVGAMILAELADEEHWDSQFAGSQNALSRLAAKARSDVQTGRADDLDPDRL
jgi:hypothetical protein